MKSWSIATSCSLLLSGCYVSYEDSSSYYQSSTSSYSSREIDSLADLSAVVLHANDILFSADLIAGDPGYYAYQQDLFSGQMMNLFHFIAHSASRYQNTLRNSCYITDHNIPYGDVYESGYSQYGDLSVKISASGCSDYEGLSGVSYIDSVWQKNSNQLYSLLGRVSSDWEYTDSQTFIALSDTRFDITYQPALQEYILNYDFTLDYEDYDISDSVRVRSVSDIHIYRNQYYPHQGRVSLESYGSSADLQFTSSGMYIGTDGATYFLSWDDAYSLAWQF